MASVHDGSASVLAVRNEPAPDTTAAEETHWVELPYEESSAVLARRSVRRVLRQWALAGLEDDVLLVVAELVANAVVHGRPTEGSGTREISVSIGLRAGVLGLRVRDHNPVPPIPRVARVGATSGRGLLLVTALSSAWTSRPTDDGGEGGPRVLEPRLWQWDSGPARRLVPGVVAVKQTTTRTVSMGES
ncbi:ATP-binding protein [Kitasatospora sp. NPDC059327]|uniref:ATP-binding protein n=1 Tax=Kitasatospora sp. NPDC059327 TaxID=3346803 RepID=UPI0036AB0723